MVLGMKSFRHEARVFRLAVVRFAKNNRKGVEPCTIATENARHCAGVNATRQEHTHRNITHHMHMDGLSDCRVDFFFNTLAAGLIERNVRAADLLLTCSQVPIHFLADRAVLPNQGVPGRQGGDAIDERNRITRRTESKIVEKTGAIYAARHECGV